MMGVSIFHIYTMDSRTDDSQAEEGMSLEYVIADDTSVQAQRIPVF